jgi:two-component system, chemotaxis family, sensor kinase CheA
MTEMEGVLEEFVEEASQRTNLLERQLIQLEETPAAAELLAAIFRGVHSLKGAASFLNFTKLRSLTHAGESLLARLRASTLAANPEVISLLLSRIDAVREILGEVSATGQEGNGAYGALIGLLGPL